MLKIIRNLLQNIIDDIDADNTYATEEDEMKIIEVLKTLNRKEKYLSKYQAYTFLNMSRASFDNKIREGLIPKGIKVEGFKELMWKETDLMKLIKNK